MYREAVISNGHFFINFDKYLSLRDLYFPYVGQYNHLGGNKNHLILSVDGKLRYMDVGWKRTFSYKKDTLITDIKAVNEELGIQININDLIHKYLPIYIRKFRVKNLTRQKKDIKIFFYHDFCLYETEVGNTALYHPEMKGILHYREATYLLISIYPEISDYTISPKKDSALRQIDKQILNRNPIARGEIDSAVAYYTNLLPEEEDEFYYYIVAGRSFDDVEEKQKRMLEEGIPHFIEETEIFQKSWIKEKREIKGSIRKDIRELYDRSLFIIKAHMDNRGAIIASADSSIFHRFNKDHYSYSWPRDNAFIVMALDRAGYGNTTKKFFEFASRTITKKGYFLQKYLPDGSFGSSWHPWIDEEGKPQLPIQEDETALVIWALHHHYRVTKDIEFIDKMYNVLVRPAADFMVRYRDERGLPLESYDPWEERRGVLTYTCATVFAGLMSASKLAHLTGNIEESKKYEKAAREVRKAILKYLYNKKAERFVKMLVKDKNGNIMEDLTVDASLLSVFFTGMLPPNDYRVINTVSAIKDRLWVNFGIGGLARFEGDLYHRIDKQYPGNPWIITTMWLADWYIATNQIEEALKLINWVVKRQTQAGLLAEQYDPQTGNPLSVVPLTWSHAGFCWTVQNLNEKLS
ncbi:glucoamylase [Persephonella hydrogeniphila]|uniref:Glucoamylase n=1 Tax=Persephonella hydrogeniphila TaxID=198703 RepID=A0A285NKT5_9AQUI|nr:glycoside hydrolase family 15 protein [Persephonella hydrogeniphila]SNZ09543.1 glucoamylase [Persephonella hydrogeniphila]